MTPSPVEQAVELLSERQRVLRDELAQVEEALVALRRVVGGPRTPMTQDPNRPSVRTKMVALLEEAQRDWSANEVVAEYERRGEPLHGRDPSNALRAAFADAKKRGMIVSTGTGRYQAAKWAQRPTPARPTPPSNYEEEPF